MRRLAGWVLAWACMLGAHAQEFVDAPYVTTPPSVVEAMLKLGGVGANDYVIDLGSGDGRIVLTAAQRFGARGHGIELDPNLVRAANREAQRLGIAERARFVTENIFHADLSPATVITMYMGASVNRRMRPLLIKLRPGTRVVSHEFDLGNWEPDVKINVAAPDKGYGAPRADVLMWYIPADFSGEWEWRLPAADGREETARVIFEQTYQKLTGKGMIAGRDAGALKAEIRGDTIRFTLGATHEFRGRIAAGAIDGTVSVSGGPATPWRAARIRAGKLQIEAAANPFE